MDQTLKKHACVDADLSLTFSDIQPSDDNITHLRWVPFTPAGQAAFGGLIGWGESGKTLI
jgi:hypothetical protein